MYLSDPVKIDVDSTRLHDLLGRSQAYPLGFTRVADHRVDRVRNEHGSVQQYLEEQLVEQVARRNGEIPTTDMAVDDSTDRSGSAGAERSLEELRERAEATAQETATATTTTTTRYSPIAGGPRVRPCTG